MNRFALSLLLTFGTLSAHAQQPARRLLGAPVQEQVIGESAALELMHPMSIAADDQGGFYLFDGGDDRVLAFDGRGKVRWTFGRSGAGPGEFRVVNDLEVERNGDVLTLDLTNARLTVISSTGRLVTTVPLPAEMNRLLPSQKSGEWMVIPHGRLLWIAIDATGATQRQAALPPEVQFSPDIVGEPYTSRTDSGAVIAYRWSSKLVLLDRDGRVRTVVPGIEELPFPAGRSYPVKMGEQTLTVTRVDPQAVRGTRSVTSRGSLVLALFGGRSEVKGRLLDRYHAVTGEYLGSYVLPHHVNEIALLSDGRLATIEHDPLPVVRIWKLPSR